MTFCWLMAVVSTPLISVVATGLLAVPVSFDLPVTLWHSVHTAVAYVFFGSTNVKPPCSISLAWEACVCVWVKHALLPSVAVDGTSFLAAVNRASCLCATVNGALVILAVVSAVLFFAEEWVLEDVDVGEVYTSSWYELNIFVRGVRWVTDEGCKVECFAWGRS